MVRICSLTICLSISIFIYTSKRRYSAGVPWWLSGADGAVKKMLDEYQKSTPKPTMLRSTATRTQIEMLPQYYAGSTIPRVPLTGRTVPPVRNGLELGAVEPPSTSKVAGSPIVPGEEYSIGGPSPDVNLDFEGGVKKLFEDLKEAAAKSTSSSSSSFKNSEAVKFLKHVQLPLTAGIGKPESGKPEPLWTRYDGVPVKKPWIKFEETES